MNCPSCNSSLEPNARFCGVCGYRLQAKQAAAPTDRGGGGAVQQSRAPSSPVLGPAGAPQAAKAPNLAVGTPKQPQNRPTPKPARSKGDELYIGQTLNNRFKIDSKIGEGGFGAVYRGIQLATGRKVALKLLHPEMTKDENLVARFRREGMVLCNLRDAHTITTYDFDQTPDGTLYIAMELLEGKSLHTIFHEQAPLDWRRMFKILTEMCSSLAEAHAQGIVHRDLKPENVYLENRPGNPEFVKILDFGIAKVMRGETIDPQAPQLTATGQTLGTLEYMSPEQLMGRQLDGRSDVYALGVVAYEMITKQLPFPNAKGPAGLITAQLKQTPIPPSQANPKAVIPSAVDRVILKCLEKDKNNRYADVTQLANALQEVLATETPSPFGKAGSSPALQPLHAHAPAELAETRRGVDPPPNVPPAMPHGMHPDPNLNISIRTPPPGDMGGFAPQPRYPTPSPIAPVPPAPGYSPQLQPPPVLSAPAQKSSKLVWVVIALLLLGTAIGAVIAVTV